MKLTRFTAAELGEMIFDPLKFVVEPIIAAGTATMLAGRPKCNKTFLAQETALAVATGSTACGQWQTCGAGDVLFYALEDNARRLQRRLNMLRPKGELPHRLQFRTTAPALGKGFREEVEAWAREADNPALVIVDTYSLILPPRAKQSYLTDYADSAAFTQIFSDLNVAGLALYHTRKSDGDDALDAVSGTTGIAGGFDSILVLRRAPVGGFILEGRGRDILPLELGLEFDSAKPRWRVLGEVATAFMGEERKAILAALHMLGEAKPKTIAERSGLSDESVRQLLRKMVEQGSVNKVAYGTYTPAHSHHTSHNSIMIGSEL